MRIFETLLVFTSSLAAQSPASTPVPGVLTVSSIAVASN